MCSRQDRDNILEKPVLKYSDIMQLMTVGASYAYSTIEDIRVWMAKNGKPLPRGKRVTSAAYKEYFEIEF